MLKFKIIISWILVIIWMIIIFWLSSMDSNLSNDRSKNTINKAIETAIVTTNKIGITDKQPSEEIKSEVTDKLNGPLRKCMHAGVYLVLAILLINALLLSSKKVFLSIIFTILISFIYACSDEYHQTFVIGRTGKFSDVLIDTFGSILGIISYGLCNLYYKKNKNIDGYLKIKKKEKKH